MKFTSPNGIRRKLGWLQIDSRRWYFAAILMYKIMRMGQPSYLKKLFTKYRYTRPARGEIKELEVPFMGPGRGNLSFQVRCAQFCNFLPSSIRFLPSLSRFKKVIRQHLQWRVQGSCRGCHGTRNLFRRAPKFRNFRISI